jgi:DNA-binding transcriptional MerR regulator
MIRNVGFGIRDENRSTGLNPKDREVFMDIKEKKYYPIREVAQITGVRESVIRFWEQNFEELQPIKNRVGQRKYTKTDIDVILLIKRLLYEDEYKISGAQKKLKEVLAMADGEQMELFGVEEKLTADRLKDIRKEIIEALHMLEN